MGVAVAGFAQLGADIARKHAERAGAKLQALQSLSGEGKTFIGKDVVPFAFISQRPNRLRVESYSPSRRVVQVYDGLSAPWISHSESRNGVPQEMTEDDAKDFIENADFDGPLVNYASKGYSVDYAGTEKIDGRDAYKLLVMNKSDNIFFIWVDTESYEMVKRTVYRTGKNKRIAVDTFFKDFRRVGGVLQPHRVETMMDGRLVYVMVTEKMEANLATIPAGTFVRPINQP
jgi:outer membrane lipoprotein-sorting protein